jgi:hypothetical protein
MTRLSYAPLTVEDFGRQLLTSQDLDPIYVALFAMNLDPITLRRWLLAYWCCYDAGVSCYIADNQDSAEFWSRMGKMALNSEPSPLGGRWRRAAERRHWRGRNASRSLADLANHYGAEPERMADFCAHGEEIPAEVKSVTCASVMARARIHEGFGPWIAFKIADMCERVLSVPVSFDAAEVFMFKDPVKAALMVYDSWPGAPVETSKHDRVAWVVDHLTKAFRDIPAPPGWDRPVGLQEVETVLCKWKSHVNGHYPLLNDLTEIRHYTLPWVKHSKLAARFVGALP